MSSTFGSQDSSGEPEVASGKEYAELLLRAQAAVNGLQRAAAGKVGPPSMSAEYDVLERERPAAVKIISPPGSPRLERLQVLDQLNQQLLDQWRQRAQQEAQMSEEWRLRADKEAARKLAKARAAEEAQRKAKERVMRAKAAKSKPKWGESPEKFAIRARATSNILSQASDFLQAAEEDVLGALEVAAVTAAPMSGRTVPASGRTAPSCGRTPPASGRTPPASGRPASATSAPASWRTPMRMELFPWNRHAPRESSPLEEVGFGDSPPKDEWIEGAVAFSYATALHANARRPRSPAEILRATSPRIDQPSHRKENLATLQRLVSQPEPRHLAARPDLAALTLAPSPTQAATNYLLEYSPNSRAALALSSSPTVLTDTESLLARLAGPGSTPSPPRRTLTDKEKAARTGGAKGPNGRTILYDTQGAYYMTPKGPVRETESHEVWEDVINMSA